MTVIITIFTLSFLSAFQLTKNDLIELFLFHLAQPLKVSASTQNQALNALAFLYHLVLRRGMGEINDIHRAKRSKHLPVTFSHAEDQKVLGSIDGAGRFK